jgi:hypothetical protein
VHETRHGDVLSAAGFGVHVYGRDHADPHRHPADFGRQHELYVGRQLGQRAR